MHMCAYSLKKEWCQVGCTYNYNGKSVNPSFISVILSLLMELRVRLIDFAESCPSIPVNALWYIYKLPSQVYLSATCMCKSAQLPKYIVTFDAKLTSLEAANIRECI